MEKTISTSTNNEIASREAPPSCPRCFSMRFASQKVFSPPDLLPSARLLHDNLVFLSRIRKKVDVHVVYALREAFTLFDFEDESIEDLKMPLILTVIAPIYLKTEDGRKFLGFIFGLSMQVMKEALAMIKSRIAFGRKSVLEAYGVILFRAWKGIDWALKEEFEDGFLQSLIEGSIYANSVVLAAFC
ncbi:CONDENSIN-2 COMPLEX SUBUNIT G2 [Salix koriyanagi]|uniref:CONDENSIN-2 COMPLEX SUBUNIT G2 n=1 Tax=Salix koriyanagi TaxID=2511006 RepID=A0A9Q0NHX6_9ROSI|nr:CONDENSIN-2 COMPLEX SUBUNIT G2 [Salix koriyanagi]